MRSPDDDGTSGDDGSVSSSLGEGFGGSINDLIDGDFGRGDIAEDVTAEDADGEDHEGFDLPGDDGDGLTDAEASNILGEILDSVFGDGGSEALDNVETDSFRLAGDDADLDEGADPVDFDITP